jgi:hypothetical protein
MPPLPAKHAKYTKKLATDKLRNTDKHGQKRKKRRKKILGVPWGLGGKNFL